LVALYCLGWWKEVRGELVSVRVSAIKEAVIALHVLYSEELVFLG
jgi:hypothetical protein